VGGRDKTAACQVQACGGVGKKEAVNFKNPNASIGNLKGTSEKTKGTAEGAGKGGKKKITWRGVEVRGCATAKVLWGRGGKQKGKGGGGGALGEKLRGKG